VIIELFTIIGLKSMVTITTTTTTIMAVTMMTIVAGRWRDAAEIGTETASWIETRDFPATYHAHCLVESESWVGSDPRLYCDASYVYCYYCYYCY
jgi:hypothetical protein